jgi:hypothetical protein
MVADNGTANPADDQFFNFYVKDSTTTYTNEILDTAANATDFLAQMNAQGARGFDFYGPLTLGTLYVKESAGATYSHEFLSPQTTNAGFLAQVNSEGDKGFLYVGSYGFDNGTNIVNIYTKITATTAKYAYRLDASLNTPDSFLAQANAQGQEGYRFAGALFFSGEPSGSPTQTRNLYVKDTTQTAKFEWKANLPNSTSAGLVAQANAEAAQGYVYWSAYAFVVGTSVTARELYFKPSACSGLLCRATSPL